MPDTRNEGWCSRLAIELVLWAGLVGTFLYLYVGQFDAPIAAIAPHLAALIMLWLGVISLRLLNWRWMPRVRTARWMAACLIALPWLALAIWYLLVLAGLSSWGRVTTWLLIKTYALQSTYLMDVLGLPSWSMLPALLLIVALPVLAAYYWLTTADWTHALVGHFSTTAATLVAALLGMISAVQIVQFVGFPPTAAQEPFSVSFSPHQGLKRQQSHNFGNTRILDSAETLVRETYQTNPAATQRNVILIVGDALRADHMSLYGYPRTTTPFLEKLAQQRQAIIIGQTRSACAESTCGLLALAASRPVHEMPHVPFTLHDILRRHGYQVHMILGGDHTNFYGLKDAYGKVDSFYDGSNQKSRYMNDDLLVLDRVVELPDHQPLQPVMLQFHLMSTHGLGLRHEAARKYLPSSNYYRWPIQGIPPKPADIPNAINYYDNGMVQFDQMVDQLLTRLQHKGYLQNALVIITGDHGEMLGEHDRFGHAHQVNEGALHIPLIFIRYGYDGPALAASSLNSQIDVAPTILDELDMPRPSNWRGRPLQLSTAPRLIHFQQSSLIGLYDLRPAGQSMKYWKDLSSGNEYVFDITADPLERNNLLDQTSATDLRLWRREVMASSLVVQGGQPDFIP